MDDPFDPSSLPSPSPEPRRKAGRPPKGDAPRINYAELDRLLVFGEQVACEDGNGTTTSFPSYRELGARYGVSVSVIGEYAKKHNCQKRRKLAEVRILARADEKQVELRAEEIAVSREEQVAIIDTYLAGFKGALAEGRVRFDNPTDYNTMSRLKEFLQGGADARHEVHGMLSLDALQARHRDAMRMMRDTTPEERGEVLAPPGPKDGTFPGSERTAAPPAVPDLADVLVDRAEVS